MNWTLSQRSLFFISFPTFIFIQWHFKPKLTISIFFSYAHLSPCASCLLLTRLCSFISSSAPITSLPPFLCSGSGLGCTLHNGEWRGWFLSSDIVIKESPLLGRAPPTRLLPVWLPDTLTFTHTPVCTAGGEAVRLQRRRRTKGLRSSTSQRDAGDRESDELETEEQSTDSVISGGCCITSGSSQRTVVFHYGFMTL